MGNVVITSNGYISMPEHIQQQFMDIVAELAESNEKTAQNIEEQQSDLTLIKNGLETAKGSDSTIDELFDALNGVLDKISSAYGSIAADAQVIKNSFSILGNIVEKGKSDSDILIRRFFF